MNAPTPPAPQPKLRPTGTTGRPGAADHRPAPRPVADERPAARTVPVRVVLLVGLAVLLVLAAFRPGGVTAVIGVPLAVALPGAVLQPRFLPGLHTDVVTRWCLRAAASLAFWALVVLAVGAAAVPVRSVWPVVVGAVLLAGVVVGEPERERRFGRVCARQALAGVVVVVVATALALTARGLVAVAGGPTPSGSATVLVAFAEPGVPVALTATGSAASAEVAVTNPADHTVHVTLGGRVGRALPWAEVGVDLDAGATRTVTVSGPVPVCSDPQQLVVTVSGAGTVAPLAAVLPGAAGGVRCGAG